MIREAWDKRTIVSLTRDTDSDSSRRKQKRCSRIHIEESGSRRVQEKKRDSLISEQWFSCDTKNCEDHPINRFFVVAVVFVSRSMIRWTKNKTKQNKTKREIKDKKNFDQRVLRHLFVWNDSHKGEGSGWICLLLQINSSLVLPFFFGEHFDETCATNPIYPFL